MKRILLTNDDGVSSPGLQLLAQKLQDQYEVYIVAPDGERSATSHSINLTRPMRLRKIIVPDIKNPIYALDGTPADCVRVGLELLYSDIDLVISGINRGYNAGADVKYSGTVGAATEATNYNIPSIAYSTEFKDGSSDFETASDVAIEVLDKYLDKILTKTKIVFNVNIPKGPRENIKGPIACQLGGPVYDRFNLQKIDDQYAFVYLLGRHAFESTEDTDRHYLKLGYTTVTPMKVQYTSNNLLQEFKDE